MKNFFSLPLVTRHSSLVTATAAALLAAATAHAARTYTLSGGGAGFAPIAAARPVMPRDGGGEGTTFVLGVPTAPTLYISADPAPGDNPWLVENCWLAPMGISAPTGGVSRFSSAHLSQFVLQSAEGAFVFERSKPDLYLGDTLAPPAEVNWAATYVAYTNSLSANTNATADAESPPAFLFDPDGQRVFAVLGGQVVFPWVVGDGTNTATMEMTYNVSPVCSGRPRRIYWTDSPFNAPAVNLKGKFVKFFGPKRLLEPTYDSVTNVSAGIQQPINNKIVSGLWLDDTTQMLSAYGQLEGQVVMAYYETGTFEKILHVQVVEICRPVVNRMTGYIGRALEPDGRGYPTEGLHARPTAVKEPDSRGKYYYQHEGQQSYSPKHGNVYPLRPTEDCPWNMEVYWMESDEMLVDWPFEVDQYACNWPEDTTVFVRGDKGGGRPIYLPTEYTATLMKYQEPEGHAKGVTNGIFTTVLKTGTTNAFSLLQLTTSDNVWFVPLRSVLRSDTNFFTLKADELPVGRELEMRGGEAAGTAGGFAPHCDPTSPGYVYAAASAPVWNPNLYQEPHADNDVAASTNGMDAATGGDTNSYESVVYTVRPGTVEVWWNTVIQEEDMPAPLVVPTLPQVYTTHWPGTNDAPQIVLASQLGSASKSVFSHNAAIYLAETSSVANLPPRKCFDPENGGTLMFWVSAEAGMTDFFPVVNLFGDSGRWTLWDDPVGTLGNPGIDLKPGSGWHHVAIVFPGTGSLVGVYVDGKLASGSFPDAPDLSGALGVALGRSSPDPDVSYAAAGLAFGEILLWNKAFTEKQIREEMHKTHTGRERNLRSCYVFVDGEDLEVTADGTRRFTERVQGRICGATNCLMELLGPPAAGTGVIEADEGTTVAVYGQNDSSAVGYNPNEEHAIVQAGSGGWVAWALRCDLNTTNSSAPGVLVEYVKNGRKAMQWFGVVATNADYPEFAAPCVAGKAFPGPHPIDFFDDPWCSKNKWDNPPATAPTFRDRKGQLWARCAGDSTNRMYYRNQEGFAYPSLPPADWPAVNAEIPWLALLGSSPSNNPIAASAKPHAWVWKVAWPDNVPQMEIGRTLTTAADGLPEVWNAKSCAIVWPQTPDERTQLFPGTQVVGFPATNTVTNLLVQFGITTNTCTLSNGVWHFNSVTGALGSRFWLDPRADVTACVRLDGDRGNRQHMLNEAERTILKAAVNAGTVKDKTTNTAARALWTTAISQLLLDSTNKPPRAILFDPTVAQTSGFPSNYAVGDLVAKFGIKSGAGGHATLRKGKWHFDDLPPNLSSRFYLDTTAPAGSCLKLVGEREDNPGGVSLLHVNVLSPAERDLIAGLVDDTAVDKESKQLWRDAVADLAANSVCPSVLTSTTNEPIVEYKPRDHYALFSMGQNGYVTLIENDATNELMNVSPGDPISMHVFEIAKKYHTGRIVTREDPYNLLSQQLSVLYEEAFAGDPGEYEFEWRMASPGTDGRVPTDYDDPDVYTLKFPLTNGLTRFVIGAQGDTLKNMVNTYYAMRYRAASTNSPAWNTMGHAWSDWTDPPALAEGWVQRVLNNVTPFAQRMRDFEENEAETAISMLRQAGAPYEGDVALNQDNLTSVGLIQLYETILSKAESMSLALGIDNADANKQLQLAAARLADLYATLGDEAWTDALNPTIGFGGDFRTESMDYGALSSSLFCFDNQVPTLLDEELALLRGRTGENAPSTRLSPYYNRLVWNLTKSPVGGEVAYMVNYDITDDGDGDGLLDHKDAARLFPQGHGDAYGHYLSALSGWYRLLRNPFFSWGAPAMGEMVVADSVVNVDYYDEAKFAKAAHDVAKTAALVVDRTARKAVRDNAGAPGAGYLDKAPKRAFGWGEWASRGGFGALANWAVGNALLPEQPDPGRHWRLAFTNGASLSAEVGDGDAAAAKLSAKKAWTVEFQLVADPDADDGGTVFSATGADSFFALELGADSTLTALSRPVQPVVLTNYFYRYGYTNATGTEKIDVKSPQTLLFPNPDGTKTLECNFYTTNVLHVVLPAAYDLEAQLAKANGTNSWPDAPEWKGEWTLADFREHAATNRPIAPYIHETTRLVYQPDMDQPPVETAVGAVPRGHNVLVAVRNPGGDKSKPVVTLFDGDGAKIAETELDFAATLSPSTLALGGFAGEIAEFRIWNGTRRTDDELLDKRECVSINSTHLTVYLRAISPTPGATQIASDVSGIVWELDGAHWIAAEESGVEIAFQDEGLVRIDRSTVPELASLASLIPDIQYKVDRLDAGVGPLGLSSGAMPFDLTPINAGDGGKTHYEQIRERAGTALENARLALDKAQEYGSRLRLLREAEDGWEAANAATELETKNKLIEYFGYPYEGDIGPGGSYPQGYDGPDIYNYAWMEPKLYGLKDNEDVQSITTNIYTRDTSKFRDGLAVLIPNFWRTNNYATFVYEKSATGLILKPASVSGKRLAQGKIQEKMGDFLVAYRDFKGALKSWEGANTAFEYQVGLIIRNEIFHNIKKAAVSLQQLYAAYHAIETSLLKQAVNCLEYAKGMSAEVVDQILDAVPSISGAGTTVNVDPEAIVSGALAPSTLAEIATADTALLTAKNTLVQCDAIGAAFDLAVWEIDTLIEYMTTYDSYYAQAKQAASAVSSAATACRNAYVQLETAQAALETVCAEAERVIDERTLARKQAASVLTKARYNEMFFRLARNNALSRYDAQFELAQKYAWLAAQAYDYETGLISSDRASGEAFLARIVGARTLGEFDSSGNPMAASDAAKGDGGLAAILAEMDANWLVLKPRLGINNPQPYATWFSLRHDLFRILEGEKGDKTWRTTLQKYVVDDLNRVPEFAHYCQPLAGSTAEKEPGLVIPFPSVIAAGLNFFGNDLAGGDASLDPTWYATHVSAAGVHLVGYDPVNLSRTPSAYLVPVGEDRMRAVGDPDTVISWKIVDQTIPAPYAIGSTQLDDPDWTPLYDGNTGGNDLGARIRKHPSFRAYYAGTNEAPSDASLDCTRLVGRSAWNTKWMLVIPASSLAADRENALDALIDGFDADRDGSPDSPGISDIRIGLKTYSTSGN